MAKAKLGSGARFNALEKSLGKKGAKNPGALAAWIGRKKYGAKRFRKTFCPRQVIYPCVLYVPTDKIEHKEDTHDAGFVVMGYLINNSVGFSDTTTVSGSLWFRIATTGTATIPVDSWIASGDDTIQQPLRIIFLPAGTAFPTNNQILVTSTRQLDIGSGVHSVAWEFPNITAPRPQAFNMNIWNHMCFAVTTTASNTQIAIINGSISTYTVLTGGSDGWAMPNNGAAFTIGSPIEFRGDNNPAFDAAVFQVWFGLFIDWANPDNYNKVVTLTGPTGVPASINAAANAFGTPHFRFSGNRSQFPINTGTSGVFSKVGTVSDYTPGPSF